MLGGIYEGRSGIDANLYLKFVDKMEWASGLFQGPVPSYFIVNFLSFLDLIASSSLGYQ